MKTQQPRAKSIIQIVIGALSLAALLSYTLVHTGGLLSSYVRPGLVGYVAAFGIELSIVGLSLRIGDLRKSGQDVRFFVGVLVAVVVVSALANVAEGFYVNQGVRLTVVTAGRLDAVQVTVGLAATGLISLIVFALAEIVGTDVNVAVRAAGAAAGTTKVVTTDGVADGVADAVDGLADVRGGRATGLASGADVRATVEPDGALLPVAASPDATTKPDAMNALLAFVAENPDASLARIGAAIGRSKTVAGEYASALKEAGRLKRNGNGWEVIR